MLLCSRMQGKNVYRKPGGVGNSVRNFLVQAKAFTCTLSDCPQKELSLSLGQKRTKAQHVV